MHTARIRKPLLCKLLVAPSGTRSKRFCVCVRVFCVRIHTKVPFSHVNRSHSCLFRGLSDREGCRRQRQLVKTRPCRLLATALRVCDALAVRSSSRQHSGASSEQRRTYTSVQESTLGYRMSRRHESPCKVKARTASTFHLAPRQKSSPTQVLASSCQKYFPSTFEQNTLDTKYRVTTYGEHTPEPA